MRKKTKKEGGGEGEGERSQNLLLMYVSAFHPASGA